GEWIESHTLHMHLLNGPDFLGFESGLELGQHFPDELKRGLRLKKIGNRLIEILGGRSVHPVNVCVGGFYQPPNRQKLLDLLPDLKWGVEAAAAATRWVSSFHFPDFEQSYDLVSLTHPEEYPFCEGTMKSSRSGSFSVSSYEQILQEYQVPHSTALQIQKTETRSSCLFGPLARIFHNREKLSPQARSLADECNFPHDCNNPYRSIIARGLEVTHAFEEAIRVIQAYQTPQTARVSAEPRAGEGVSATEAPRGTLYHRYLLDESGKIELAIIIPPTSQNQRQIELDLFALLPGLLKHEESRIATECEKLIRTYDPCISCATHFLKLSVERGD
ncbi:MAG: nickel-dependent hydrogenase large subunit, partial [Planctomycetaceae bacterium]|nr:nickel-dependent hydrogenase large subunit [Planctomycetaceae bacterium]